jgi:transcriptional regulator with XRE-family HTH domain
MLLKDYIKKNNLTQRAMAEKLGITITHLRMLMLGKSTPSPKLAIKIEEVTKGDVPKEVVIFYKEK